MPSTVVRTHLTLGLRPALLVALLLPAAVAAAQEAAAPPPAAVPFSEFGVRVDVEETEFEVRGSFKLGAGSNGINLFKEAVVVRVGDFMTATIPAGSFVQEERGKVSYKGVVEGINLDVSFRVLGRGGFQLKVEGEGTKRAWRLRPEDIRLTVGDDGGSAAAQASGAAK